MERGAIVGEMALITGELRPAAVRARDGALIYEARLIRLRLTAPGGRVIRL
jgi:hypothetical protein